jgi:hypothetical protein
MARLKIIGPQGSPCWAPTEEEINDHRKIKLKDFYSIDKAKGKEVGYDIALLLGHRPFTFSSTFFVT